MDSYSQELNPNTNPLSSRNSHNTTRTSPPSPRHDQALRPRRSLRPRLRRDLCEGRRMLRLEEGRVHVRRRCRFLELGPERSRNRRNRSGTRSGRCCCTPGELDGCSPTVVTSVSLIVPFYGPTTTNTFGRVIIRPIRSKRPPSVLLSTSLPTSILGSSKVHSTSSASNTQPGISQRALEKPNNGGTGGGSRDGSVAANVENRGCLSWGGRGWGAYSGSPMVQARTKHQRLRSPTPTRTRIRRHRLHYPPNVKTWTTTPTLLSASPYRQPSLPHTSLGSEDAIHPEPALPIAIPMSVTPPAPLEPKSALSPPPLQTPPELLAAFTSMTPGSTPRKTRRGRGSRLLSRL
ncbi:hypothetical protein D9611_012356 [Ephemerocybe angulata]|uniref:Uncharacterized protein n=1 Tax=Ephemerocybe angulata TaxID=980116 RepID=A0A8H5FKS9_9AGAR|nr:hypothetical protein D9611_012356 [Tulosesus angulatus]